ncbi:unnamed protein product [Phytophthora fragariaefolia]|uniref:Unnamed protein product n=1 Tax=Phytophthora fragariaefolia TaxID=1490495 RepID=A0A9W6YE98_9STRA|nr:unnamed protein product [Phytophthora fragariaefolia]
MLDWHAHPAGPPQLPASRSTTSTLPAAVSGAQVRVSNEYCKTEGPSNTSRGHLSSYTSGAPSPEPLRDLEQKTVRLMVANVVVGPPRRNSIQILRRVGPNSVGEPLEPLFDSSDRDPVSAFPERETEVRALGPPNCPPRELTPKLHHNSKSPNRNRLVGHVVICIEGAGRFRQLYLKSLSWVSGVLPVGKRLDAGALDDPITDNGLRDAGIQYLAPRLLCPRNGESRLQQRVSQIGELARSSYPRLRPLNRDHRFEYH